MKLTTVFVLLLLVSLSLNAFESVRGSEIHDVAVTNVTVSPSKIVVGKFFTSNVIVENQGTSIETFNITLYAAYESFKYDVPYASGNLTILNLTVTDLAPGSSRALTLEYSMFPWRREIWIPYSGILLTANWWPYWDVLLTANFTIRVEAEVLPGEADTSDNVYVDGSSIAFWKVFDINGDGKIDGRDIATVCKAFGSYPGKRRWNPDADINQDGKIDGKDLAPSCKHCGMIYG